ncbi:MAG TPA: hypothetical protein VGP86_05950 [Xanthobacteraceae bacterium]|nr:hypothetical protein [Xanthobacteraceae bacterium]
MARRVGSSRIALLAVGMLAATSVLAADVTPERLLNPAAVTAHRPASLAPATGAPQCADISG